VVRGVRHRTTKENGSTMIDDPFEAEEGALRAR
jgi:hypothetical protein